MKCRAAKLCKLDERIVALGLRDVKRNELSAKDPFLWKRYSHDDKLWQLTRGREENSTKQILPSSSSLAFSMHAGVYWMSPLNIGSIALFLCSPHPLSLSLYLSRLEMRSWRSMERAPRAWSTPGPLNWSKTVAEKSTWS